MLVHKHLKLVQTRLPSALAAAEPQVLARLQPGEQLGEAHQAVQLPVLLRGTHAEGD